MNLVMEKYHTEFVNMLNLSLRPAYPASGVVVMNLIEGSVTGVQVPAGTRLIGQEDTEDARQIFFETVSDLYVTGAKLTDVFQASGTFGKLLPVRGCRPRQELPGTAAREEREAAAEESLETEQMPEIPLFDFDAQGIQRWALVLTHDTLFRTRENIELRVAVRGPAGGGSFRTACRSVPFPVELSGKRRLCSFLPCGTARWSGIALACTGFRRGRGRMRQRMSVRKSVWKRCVPSRRISPSKA